MATSSLLPFRRGHLPVRYALLFQISSSKHDCFWLNILLLLQQNDIQPTNHEREEKPDTSLLPPPPPPQRVYYSYFNPQNEVLEDQDRWWVWWKLFPRCELSKAGLTIGFDSLSPGTRISTWWKRSGWSTAPTKSASSRRRVCFT